MLMPDQKAMEAGRQFEREFAKLIGGELVPGSGSQWHAKLDVGGTSILWSLKWSSAEGVHVTPATIAEAVEAVHGPGGKGRGMVPGIAVSAAGEPFVVQRLSDYLATLSSDDPIVLPSTKARQRRSRASKTALERREETQILGDL